MICEWCKEDFDPHDLRMTDSGCLCDSCIEAIRSRGYHVIIFSKHADDEVKVYSTKSAVGALDIFTKLYCRDPSEDDLVFNCKKCAFATDSGICLVKKQAKVLSGGRLPYNFGSMSR